MKKEHLFESELVTITPTKQLGRTQNEKASPPNPECPHGYRQAGLERFAAFQSAAKAFDRARARILICTVGLKDRIIKDASCAG